MSDTMRGTGHCMCGAVKFSAPSLSKELGACHCDMCRRWGGGPLLANDCGTDVTFEGADNITVFESSEWAERGFCNKCGSNLFYRLKDKQQYIRPTGLFDNTSGMVFDHQVFIEEKPDYYRFANETKDMTGAELFAQFAPPPKAD